MELGVSVPEVLEAYQYIVEQTSASAGKNNRNKARAIIYDRKRLMRKALRSLIFFWYGIPTKINKLDDLEQSFGIKAPLNTEPIDANTYYSNIDDWIPEKLSKYLFMIYIYYKNWFHIQLIF